MKADLSQNGCTLLSEGNIQPYIYGSPDGSWSNVLKVFVMENSKKIWRILKDCSNAIKDLHLKGELFTWIKKIWYWSFKAALIS